MKRIRTRDRSFAMLALVATATGLLVGCATNEPDFPQVEGQGKESRLRVGDQLQVRLDPGSGGIVYGGGAPQPPQVQEVAIDENGEISLPLVGRITAAGLTTSELSERIEANYVPRFYVHCSVTVLVTVRYFYVGGEVRQPGRYPWSEDVTLLKAINTSGGFTDYANRGKVEVARGGEKRVFNCQLLRQHPDKDVAIRPGDSIYVPRSIF